jgi:uncharacterized protein
MGPISAAGMRRHGFLSSWTAGALVAFVALVIVGCGGAPPTATATASPTRTPAPVATPAPASADLTVIKASGEQVGLRPVEIADTADLQHVGLSGRATLAENAGMLFVFDGDVTTGFWMHNTTIPLSIAFIGADGRIVDIQNMEPLSDLVHYSAKPYRFALEVNQGFYARHAIAIGDRVQVDARLRSRAPGL